MTTVYSSNTGPVMYHLDKVVQGDDFSLSIAFRNKNDLTPFDLTGYSFKMQVRRADKSLVFTLEQPTNITVIGNIVTITISNAHTSMMEPCFEYYYDLQSSNGGNITTWIRGRLIVMQQVTV